MNFSNETIIIGIDPGLNHMGWGVIAASGNRISWVAHGVINPNPKMELSQRLGKIALDLKEILEIYRPHEASVEETFVANSAKSSLLLGQARGAAMATLAINQVSVFEYSTRAIKKSLVGTGAAEKDQVAFMVKRLLPTMGLTPPPSPSSKGRGDLALDAADALAAAIAHSSFRNSPQARMAK